MKKRSSRIKRGSKINVDSNNINPNYFEFNKDKIQYSPNWNTWVLRFICVLSLVIDTALLIFKTQKIGVFLGCVLLILFFVLLIMSLFKYERFERIVITVMSRTVFGGFYGACFLSFVTTTSSKIYFFIFALVGLVFVLSITILIIYSLKTPFKTFAALGGIIVGIATVLGTAYSYKSLQLSLHQPAVQPITIQTNGSSTVVGKYNITIQPENKKH